jgi:hypothetical protein
MGLQHITDDGTLHWDCPNGHPGQSAHISHEQVEWMPSGGAVALPPCPECGFRWSIKTDYTEQELIKPVITRGIHPITGQETILSVHVRGATNFTWMNVHYETWKVGNEEVTIQIIDEVFVHPMVGRHLELKQQLLASGKKPAERQTP